MNLSHIAAYEPTKLPTIYNELIVERMKLDKKFSDFLMKNEDKMGEDVGTAIWRKYRAMNLVYTKLVKDITMTEFYMNRK